MPLQQPSPSPYSHVMQTCREVFQKKHRDYGTAWRILRLPAITDQMMIKAQRIRSISDKGQQRVADSIPTELIGIINYGVMALIQLRLSADEPLQIPEADVQKHYDGVVSETMQLLDAKNHDYGEAWRVMRFNSIIDIVLMKLLRIKSIEDNANQTCVSEGVASNYQDIINYAVFASLKQAAQCHR